MLDSEGNGYVLSATGVRSRREIVVGVTGSGKGWYADARAEEMKTGHVIRIDPMAADPDAVSVTEVMDLIREDISRGALVDIVCSLDPDDLAALAETMVPRPRGGRSIAEVLGGMLLIIDEADIYARAGGKGEREIGGLFRRGRHYGLSVIAITQAPRNIGKEVTAMAEVVTAFRLWEPRDTQYLVAACGSDFVDIARNKAWRHPYRALRLTRSSGVLETVHVIEAGPSRAIASRIVDTASAQTSLLPAEVNRNV